MPLPIKPSQKEVERRQFDRFAEISKLILDGTIVESEEPDFLVHRPNITLGIELTDLFWEQQPGKTPPQATESLRGMIAEAAGKIYSSQGLPALHVSVHFSHGYVLRKRDITRLSEAIAKLVSANRPDEGGHFEEEYDWENREYFPEEINRISAWRLSGQDRPFFTSPGAAFIPKLEIKDIERALELKEPKLKSYRRNCTEVWLVINCDAGRLATVFEHDEKVLSHQFRSGFDRVFLFRHMAGKVHELCLLQNLELKPPTDPHPPTI